MDTLWLDLRYGVRSLVRTPGLTSVAVLMLALGIGANTVLFTVTEAVVFRPLPFEEPDRLVALGRTSYANFVDWRDESRLFEGMTAFTEMSFSLTGEGQPERVLGAEVGANFFSLFGVSPPLGRSFLEEEGEGQGQVVILSHGLWERRFGADPNVIGKTVRLEEEEPRSSVLRHGGFEVVGVAPALFQFPEGAEIWLPYAASERLKNIRKGNWLTAIGRLAPGATLGEARAEMDAITDRLEQEYPGESVFAEMTLVPVKERILGRVRPALRVLSGAVIFILLIACANVAHITLARAAKREKELAVRTSLGAGGFRLMRQLLTESLLLGTVGGALGMLLAHGGVRLFVGLAPAGIPRLEEVGIGAGALSFTVAISWLTAIVFGLPPALQTSRPNLSQALKDSARGSGTGPGGRRFTKLLVVSEISLAFVLMAGTGVLLRSFWNLQAVDLGFRRDRVLTLRLDLPNTRYPEPHQRTAFYDELLEEVGAIPAVRSVSAVSDFFRREPGGWPLIVEGRPLLPMEERTRVPFVHVSPSFFRMMGIPLLRGRLLLEKEARNGSLSVVINETAARELWPDEDSLGKRFRPMMPTERPYTVIGVVGDVHHRGAEHLPDPVVYVSYRPPFPYSFPGRATLLVGTTAEPTSLAGAVRERVWSLDRNVPVSQVASLEELLGNQLSPRRFNLVLLALFAGLALVLSAAGAHGVVSSDTGQRTREIGIRMALGARPRDVLELVVREGLFPVLLGMILGLAGAFALSGVVSSFLFGVSSTDPVTYLVITLVLGGAALLACYLPARRATRIEPTVALRH